MHQLHQGGQKSGENFLEIFIKGKVTHTSPGAGILIFCIILVFPRFHTNDVAWNQKLDGENSTPWISSPCSHSRYFLEYEMLPSGSLTSASAQKPKLIVADHL